MSLVSRVAAGLLAVAAPVAAATTQVNFQSEGASVPAGYVRDFGEPYGPRTGTDQGSGLTYGWVAEGTQNPLDLTGEGRDRNSAADQRLDTLIHLDRPANPGPAGAWEIELPVGSYAVTVAVGDPTDLSGEHWVAVEGVLAVLDFDADTTFPHATATVVVDLTDGRLTIDSIGGDDTRLNYVDIVDVARTRINFQTTAAPVPAGYLKDFGEAFGLRSGADQGSGLTFGWVTPGTQTPIDMTTEGRDREAIAEQRLDTLMHMNRPGAPATGSWEIPVVEPAYTVSLSAGDPSHTDSTHHILVEGSPAIDTFQPTAQEMHRSATVAIAVGDGRLTLDGSTGTNSKINYVELVPAPGDNPRVSGLTPGDGQASIPVDVFVSASVLLPAASLDSATVNTQTVLLYPTGLRGQPVPAVVNTTGGGDAVVLDPVGQLAGNTSYTFEITSGVRDLSGNAFLPFRSTFDTTVAVQTQLPTVTFERVELTGGTNYSSLAVGPDGKLYGLTIDGLIHRWAIEPDGTLSNQEILDSLQLDEGGSRLAIGLVHDPASSASEPIVWVTHTTFGFSGMPDWGGRISRLSGANLETVERMVTGLPRSARDHVTNGAVFGSDGALYVLQGSNSAMGAPDTAWANRPERALTACVLRIDPGKLTSPPLDVQTEEGGTYDPLEVNAAVTVHASGVRNAYDLVWHTNGRLYVPTNGSAAGGNTPASPDPLPASCQDRPDGPYTGPAVPGISGVNQTQADYLYRIEAGGYYGHPNPQRCEWVLNGGNPTSGTDPAQVSQYAVGTGPDPNFRGFAFDFANNKSPNGVVEYRGDAFGGMLRGALLVARYSGGDDLIVLYPDALTGDVDVSFDDVDDFEGFADPLDLTEDPATGNLYVSEYGAPRLTLLRVVDNSAADVAVDFNELIFSAVQNTVSPARAVLLTNTGNTPLDVFSHAVVGADASLFVANSLDVLPLQLQPGETTTFSVTFQPTSTGVFSATLAIASDRGTTAIGLYGLGMQGLEGSNEPPLQQVADTLGYGIDVGGSQLQLGTSATPIGDEVATPLFVRAGPGPVTMLPVARYSPSFVLPFGRYLPNDTLPVHLEVGQLGDGLSPPEHQMLYPPVAAGGSEFDPGGSVFGFYTTSPSHSAYSEDSVNAALFPGNVAHAARVYPLRGRYGVPVAFSYLVSFEEASNGDYQDYVFAVTNVRPAPVTERPDLTLGDHGPDARLDWGPTSGGSLSDVAVGDLGLLRSTGGDFAAAADACLADDAPRFHEIHPTIPPVGAGWWFLVRCADCSLSTYDTDGAGQTGTRDTVTVCP